MSFSFQDATLLKSYEKVFIFFKTDKYQKGLVTIEKLLLHGASSFRILVMSRKKRKIDIELEKKQTCTASKNRQTAFLATRGNLAGKGR